MELDDIPGSSARNAQADRTEDWLLQHAVRAPFGSGQVKIGFNRIALARLEEHRESIVAEESVAWSSCT